ncbi:MAG: hypothetical protein V4683_20230 [Bacteroidota bacterium]
MKKLILFIAIIFSIQLSFGQNVGIGINSPNASALLDLYSTNKGVLFPRVFLDATVDNNSVPNPAQYLIVYNTNAAMTGGKGLFQNTGTNVSANWTKVGDLQLPYSSGTSTPGYAFNIQNYAAGSGANAIEGFSQNAIGVKGWSAAGTGVYAYSTTGNALEVSGKLKIEGVNQTAAQGKVLTSDANGNATWEGAVAFASYYIQPDGAAEISHNVEKKVAFYTEEYDLGNNYNKSSISPYSTFTTPTNGIYHFDVKIIWLDGPSSGYSDLDLRATKNGITKNIMKDALKFDGTSFLQHNLNLDVKLEEGTQVYLIIKQSSGDTIALLRAPGAIFPEEKFCYFTGRLVIKL